MDPSGFDHLLWSSEFLQALIVVSTDFSSSASMTFRTLLLQAPGFQKNCSAKSEAYRRQQYLLTARCRWMHEEEGFNTFKDFNVIFLVFHKVFLLGHVLINMWSLGPL